MLDAIIIIIIIIITEGEYIFHFSFLTSVRPEYLLKFIV